MPNPEHLARITEGAGAWNRWRALSGYSRVDLGRADLSSLDLSEFDLRNADLRRARLEGTDLTGTVLRRARLMRANLRKAKLEVADVRGADLTEANLRDARMEGSVLNRARLWRATLVGSKLGNAYLSKSDFTFADLSYANLSGSDISEANFRSAKLDHSFLVDASLVGARCHHASFREANLTSATLRQADLSAASFLGAHCDSADFEEALLIRADLTAASCAYANFRNADLRLAGLVRANLVKADLSGALVYGASVWDARLEEVRQKGLIVNREGTKGAVVSVDDIEVAQFIYLLLRSDRLRKVIDVVTRKLVLVLGRFSAERKGVLDRIVIELRDMGFVPVLFDFPPVPSRNLTETVSTLAHLAYFVVADLSDPRSVPQELQRVVPHLPSVPVQPLVAQGQTPYGMFDDLRDYGSVLPPLRYASAEDAARLVREKVLGEVEKRNAAVWAARADRLA
jgi:uncharacterized protein YjbI with pentapeptide repeats